MMTKPHAMFAVLALSAGLGAGLSLDAQSAVGGRQCYEACDAAYEICIQDADPHHEQEGIRDCLIRQARCYDACDTYPDNPPEN